MVDSFIGVYDFVVCPITKQTTIEEWLSKTDKRITNALDCYGLKVKFNSKKT